MRRPIAARLHASTLVHGQRRWETTGAHHQYEPGPVARALRRAFVAVMPTERRKRVASRLHDGLSKVEKMEKEAQWIRTHGSPLRVLGLPEHADLIDVKTRYKDLLFETHPDTAAAAAHKVGDASLTAGAAGTSSGSSDVVAVDERERQLQVERFELLLEAHRMATDPLSVWHQNGAAPELYRELRPNMTALRDPVNQFGLASYVLAFCAFAVFAVKIVPAFWEGALEGFDPKFFKFMKAREADEARQRAMGIEPDTDPNRLAPERTKRLVMPGKLLLDPSEEEADVQWRPGNAQ